MSSATAAVSSTDATTTYNVAPADASTSSSSSSAPAGVSKSLLLRVKRKRHESPLETLLVTSERSEKKAALQDLRQQFQSTNIDATVAANAASPAVITSPSGFSTKPVTAARMRVFRLLTSTSAPKDTHTSDPTIAARIAQLRQRASRTGSGPSLPSLVPTAEDVTLRHRVSHQLSQQEKRELRLQDNREKLLRLQQQSMLREPTQQLVHASDELQLKIVDIQLPKTFKETFAPPPASADQSKQHQRRREKEARESREVMSNSHRSASSISTVDPLEAAKQFTTAMTAIKAMPSVGRTQMDTYKALLEDYLSTLPDQPKPATATQVAPVAAAPAAPSSSDSNVTPSTQHEPSIPAQEPFVNQVAPKVPLRRRKKPAAAPSILSADEPISFMSTADQPPPKQILAEVRTAGGQAYEPDMLVPASGFSMHAAKKKQAPAVAEEDDDEYVYDVYQMEDEAAASSSTASASSILTDEDYKARYSGPGVSSAYVVVKDGVLEWVGGGEELVNEAEFSDDDEANRDDDDDENEMSDYPEEEDSSAEEDETRAHDDEDYHASHYQSRHYHDSSHAAVQAEWDELSSHPHQIESLRHLKKTQPASHGYYASEEGPVEPEEDEEEIVREVRKAIKGGREDLSSDDDEECVHYHPQRAQEDEDYLDSIEAEEDMDHMREEEDGNEDNY